ncbi:glycerophosphodiester phosphodiesterase [Bacillus luteolus]|uniref:Glycerophosphodiester phosphodiesterase n=1 Tax=Litchfieldia luteola TaxID=682179 RepID=A0ABR9QIP9_9BACI|nr:glycerophosphodiester phosphodiesterase family protein [Cytobacillus luteolus]MBE4908375.1 glycerophosphodiester phosphodiesterase [Cytobacillus luteolus]MBP1943163.1 glycerophosphoryl diester phosphodiesterase [Cytobacillus luteolus]
MNTLKKIGRSTSFRIALLLFIFIYINNSSIFVNHETSDSLLLAHRGIAQTFSFEGIDNNTCTAERIYPPEHPYLENTITSMEAAFDAGADIVELDIHPTSDGQFAVFHDWTLDCRTSGTGVTREHTMAELKSLDIGYGYTADNGKTYPFRGKGQGLMPSLDEVLSYFPDQSFLIHIKSNDPNEGIQLAQYLADLSPEQLSLLSVYGGDNPIAILKQQMPALRVMSKATMKDCLIPYFATGWTGIVPSNCKNSQLHLPEKIAPWIWGWPHKFISRMENEGTRVIVVAGDGGFSEGFDQKEDLERLPEEYFGGIWTNRIDIIAPLLNKMD